jgi:hypothetical protein
VEGDDVSRSRLLDTGVIRYTYERRRRRAVRDR